MLSSVLVLVVLDLGRSKGFGLGFLGISNFVVCRISTYSYLPVFEDRTSSPKEFRKGNLEKLEVPEGEEDRQTDSQPQDGPKE